MSEPIIAENANTESPEELSRLLQIRREKLAALQQEGRDPFQAVKYPVDTHSVQIHEHFAEMEGQVCRVAGRMMTKRLMGKASFCDLQDRDGRIQLYVRRDAIGEEAYDAFKRLDIGDIIGAEGVVFKTQKGEISLKAHGVELLSKSLQILPEKWHGLKDQELRYRQRYLDLIVNPDVRETFIRRSHVIKTIRAFLDSRDFLEVDTPVLQTVAGGAAARPFITHHNSLDMDMHLRISLELPLKRLIVGGLERVYEMGRVFRNEGLDIKHNPEFTLLELYQAYTDYEGMMELIESLIREVALKVTGSLSVPYGDAILNFGAPFARMTMTEAVKQFSGVDFDQIQTLEEARAAAKEKGVAYEEQHAVGEILSLFFEEYAEKNLIQPTFVLDYPIEISPLSKKISDRPSLTQRFELFIVGREFANAFSELNDPLDQRQRFERQAALLAGGDQESYRMDEDFLLALEYGMPPTGGLGLGVERLIMLMTNAYSIRDVMLFPTMKPV
ncbi:MAG: lysine--tRNA ligase [Clostridiales bacterium]|jgi:lysyl-tRNA synthetase class 2|nr:lysine--tRNA ligase [Clostridiales bacterium]